MRIDLAPDNSEGIEGEVVSLEPISKGIVDLKAYADTIGVKCENCKFSGPCRIR